MIWASLKGKTDKKMNLRRQQLTCFSLLLLMTLIFKSPSFADGYGRFNKFKPASSSSSSPSSSPSSSSEFSHVKQQQQQGKNGFFSFKNGEKNAEEDYKNGYDEIFGDDKRKIYTGPNPLHNR